MEGLMTDNEDEALTLRPMIWRPSSLEETLILEKIVGRRGNKRMRLWDGITYSKDMHLRKLHEIVKDREACCVAKHVITKSQTWLSNWTIPMRTQGPVKPLALVEVEKYLGGRGSFPSSGTILESKARSTRFWMCYQILYSKKYKAISCRSGSFDWVCSLDFTDRCGRDLEWAEKTRWPDAGGPGSW